MKKNLPIFLSCLLSIASLCSCKKETAAVPVKDYTASISERTSWGMLEASNTSITECYSLHFNADHTLLWSQASGDYTGRWSLTGNKIGFSYNNPSITVSASITAGNKLEGITATNNRSIRSASLVTDTYMALDNTLWRGDIGNPSQSLQLNFLASTTLNLKVGGYDQGKISYTRSSSGAFIRFSFASNDFLVLSPARASSPALLPTQA